MTTGNEKERLNGGSDMSNTKKILDKMQKGFDQMNKKFKDIDKKFDAIDKKFDAIDKKFDGIDKRFDGIDKRFDGIDKRFDGIDERFDGVDKRLDNLEHSTRDIQLTIENEIRPNIQVIAEGHLNLDRKLNEVLKVDEDKEMMKIRLTRLENEVRMIKEQQQI